MIVGFARERLRPAGPFDPQGFAARDRPATAADPDLSVTACVIRSAAGSIVIISADVLGHAGAVASEIRSRVAAEVGCEPSEVLVAATHTHASLWPGSAVKVSGQSIEEWLPGEREYVDALPELYARVARRAAADATEGRASWGQGGVPGLAVNRREVAPDGQRIIGWNPDGEVDDTVTAIRFDGASGEPLGTIVGFACHPVVLGPVVASANADFVGPLRDAVESLRGGTCLFLQGASGDVQPREALHDERGHEVEFGRRIAIEAVRAIADEDPWPKETVRASIGRWTPTAIYRSSLVPGAVDQIVRAVATTIDVDLLPLQSAGELRADLDRLATARTAASERGEPRSVTNGLDNQIRWTQKWLNQDRPSVPGEASVEIWAGRIGDGVIVGISAEPFASIGRAIQAGGPPGRTFVSGCCGAVVGYLPNEGDYSVGGFEVVAGHRIYGLPGAVAPDSAARVTQVAADLVGSLF
jgi:hypothetical protein